MFVIRTFAVNITLLCKNCWPLNFIADGCFLFPTFKCMVLGLENVLNNSLHQLTLPEESLIVNVAIL